jgi:hypothetical protein
LADQLDAFIQDKSLVTGKFDYYDREIDAVRNLKLMELGEDVGMDGDRYRLNAQFRDMRSGDIVTMDFFIEESDEEWLIEEWVSRKFRL